MKVLIVYNSEPLPDNRVKTLASWRKLATTKVIFSFDESYQRTLVDKILNRMGLPTDPCRLNKRVLEEALSYEPNIIFFVKSVDMKPSTLKALQKSNIKTVFWSNDDMWAKHNRSLWFTWGARYFDLVVTQKSYNCNPNELPSFGVKHLLFQDKAYDPAMHRPVDSVDARFKHDVVLIGTYEKERLQSIMYLANHGIKVDVYGWAKTMDRNFHPNITFHNYHLWDADYCKTITNSKISLNFLRKMNRDLQTSRSIEIPACRGFMIAERTNEHLRLFKEGKEAEFFSDDDELLRKVQFYLKHDKLRSEIAQAGYCRCMKDRYDFDYRMEEIWLELFPNEKN